jgi:hypothetical protein
MKYDMLWVQGRRHRILDGKRRWFDAGEIPKVLYRGPRATDDAGPGSGAGSKVRIQRQDTLEVTFVYAQRGSASRHSPLTYPCSGRPNGCRCRLAAVIPRWESRNDKDAVVGHFRRLRLCRGV